MTAPTIAEKISVARIQIERCFGREAQAMRAILTDLEAQPAMLAVIEALREFIYETTHLCAPSDDGSHRARISKETLQRGRIALAALPPAPETQ